MPKGKLTTTYRKARKAEREKAAQGSKADAGKADRNDIAAVFIVAHSGKADNVFGKRSSAVAKHLRAVAAAMPCTNKVCRANFALGKSKGGGYKWGTVDNSRNSAECAWLADHKQIAVVFEGQAMPRVAYTANGEQLRAGAPIAGTATVYQPGATYHYKPPVAEAEQADSDTDNDDNAEQTDSSASNADAHGVVGPITPPMAQAEVDDALRVGDDTNANDS